MTLSIRRVVAGLAMTGIATATPLIGAGWAAADPDVSGGPHLSGSDCTWAQINAALNVEDPVLAGLIDGHPELVDRMQHRYDLPPQDRRDSDIEIFSRYPDIEARMEFLRQQAGPGTDPIEDKFDRVANTCHNF